MQAIQLVPLAQVAQWTDNFTSMRLGSGAYGEVVLGHIASSGLVAVKRINPQVLADLTLLQQNAVLRALHNEIAVMQRLNAHPNIARLLYYAQKDDALALVYQLAANGTLYKQLHKEPAEGEPECRLSWQQRLKVLEGVALGLRHMHTCGVFHRDVSAANIGLDAGWGALLLDVGIALMAPLPNGNATNAELTSIHSMTVNMATAAGTWAYMDRQAPPGRYDEKNEVYALGVLILEVVSGRKPLLADPHRPGSAEISIRALFARYYRPGGEQAFMLLLDHRPGTGGWPWVLACRLVALALQCTDEDDRAARPGMREVLLQLRQMCREYLATPGEIPAMELQRAAAYQQQAIQQQPAPPQPPPAQPATAAAVALAPKECAVCGEAVHITQGIACRAPAEHFVCNGCFDGYVRSQLAPESRILLARRDWQLQCTLLGGCSDAVEHAYQLHDMATHVSPETFALYIRAKVQTAEDAVHRWHEERVRQQEEAARTLLLEQRAKARQKQLAAAEFEQLKGGLVCSIEDALTLRRPCCGGPVAIGTWDGCGAVFCDCGARFCGVCLEYTTQDDAHPHVRSCPKNPSRSVFVPDADMRAAHLTLARSRLQGLLARFAAQPRLVNAAVTACERHLTDAGLAAADFTVRVRGGKAGAGGQGGGKAAGSGGENDGAMQALGPQVASTVRGLAQRTGQALAECVAALLDAQLDEELAEALLQTMPMQLDDDGAGGAAGGQEPHAGQPVTWRAAAPGLRVTRGPNWKTSNNQDSGPGGVGTLVGPVANAAGARVPLYYNVRWDRTGATTRHRVGSFGNYDLAFAQPEQPAVPPPQANILITLQNAVYRMRVLRGRDWQGGEQDGGAGRLGALVYIDPHGIGWAQVEWDATPGMRYTYKIGAEGQYELYAAP